MSVIKPNSTLLSVFLCFMLSSGVYAEYFKAPLSSDGELSAYVDCRDDYYIADLFDEDFTSEDERLTVLKRYYELLVDQSFIDVIDLYTDTDGSKSRIRHDIDSGDLNLSNYTLLEKVSVDGYCEWSNYRIYRVLLEGSGLSLNWLEPVVCEEDNCFMSDIMLDQSNALASFGIGRALSEGIAQSAYSEAGISIYPTSSSSIENPVYLGIGVLDSGWCGFENPEPSCITELHQQLSSYRDIAISVREALSYEEIMTSDLSATLNNYDQNNPPFWGVVNEAGGFDVVRVAQLSYVQRVSAWYEYKIVSTQIVDAQNVYVAFTRKEDISQLEYLVFTFDGQNINFVQENGLIKSAFFNDQLIVQLRDLL